MFADPVKATEKEQSRLRQHIYLEALSTLHAFDIVEGHFMVKPSRCRHCSTDFIRLEEKMTDVNIATQLVADAFLNRFDSAIVVSGDSDLAPPISLVREHFSNNRIVVAFPPMRRSLALTHVATTTLQIWDRTLKVCQLPESVTKADGVVLSRPAEWR